MAYPPITLLPVAPSRQRPETFADESDAFLSAMVPFGTDVNGAGTYFDATVGTATAAAATAVSSAATAVSNSTASAASAIDANTSKTVAAGSATAASASANSASASKDLAYTYSQNAASAVAYQDLTSIAASKAVTATDVFVYDTSKDTDGGAWRKRTQGTSWYNEALNTATRGSRKEFPAVAVIVAEANKVTIYDGDDPSLPMWMVFLTSGTNIVGEGNSHQISMLNASLVVGSLAYDLYLVKFLGDNGFQYSNPSTNISGDYKGSIGGRNSNLGFGVSGGPYIVNRIVNDVAMTVLPDAPIDPATGLQIPTIAVATNGGLSIIKDNGTVANLASSTGAGGYEVYDTWFDTHNNLYAIHSYDNSNYGIATLWGFYAETLRQVQDASQNQGNGEINWGYFGRATSLPIVKGDKVSTDGWVMKGGTATGQQEIAIIGNGFLSQAQLDLNNFTKGLVNYTASSYTSGWMPGDIKGAFLADTDTVSLVGSGELVTNGTFGTNIAGWTASATASLSLDANRIKVTNTTAATSFAFQAVPTVIGETYTATFDTTVGTSTNVIVQLGNSGAGGGQYGNVAGAGFGQNTFVAVSTTLYITLLNGNGINGGTCFFDNISVKLADADRSVNNKGLVVNGTITRTAVATGAELVGYSGFSASNYLEQPYNAGLDFGTGDFSILVWARTNINGTFFSRGDGVSAGSWFWRHLGNSTAPFYIHNGTSLQLVLNVALPQADFVFLTLVRRSGVVSLYANGQLISSVSGTNPALSMTNLTAKLRIGEQQDASYVSPQEKQALLRISATAPSEAQIAKIYNDEKFLFQENAACTLYGTSDAVTALAHDDTTDLLHVGTSAGRSVFDGLRRVSNTTVAVGTAISASNNLIVEE